MITPEEAPWAQDKMNRKGVAKFLTKHLDSNEKIKVLNINSEWGSGKTFFLENWRKEAQLERVCIHFNAWENDFTGDAFLSLVATIRDQLTDHIGTAQNIGNSLEKFTKVAAKTLLAATPALTKGVVKKITGIDVSVLSNAIDEEAFSDAAEKAVEKLISSNKETLETVASFKSTFEKLLEKAKEAQEKKNPVKKDVYIFIDELDRCRPTFAIELLERIKHLFAVNQCKFIIATDTRQLGHSIKAVYGAEFSAAKYLKRFFDAEFSLDNNDLAPWISANVDFRGKFNVSQIGVVTSFNSRHAWHDSNSNAPTKEAIVNYELNEQQTIILALALTFNTRLRELEKILMQIESMQASTSSKTFYFFWAAYLIFLKDADSELYNQALNGDSDLARQEIYKKYPSKHLYFGNISTPVHDIFDIYLIRYLNGEIAAKDIHTKSRGESHVYIQAVNEEWYREYNELKYYPKLVDLAHRLE
jgi:hypothetical protein